MTIEIADETDKLEAYLIKLTKLIEKNVEDSLEKNGEAGKKIAAKVTRRVFTKGTGNLANSWQSEKNDEGATVFTEVPYAAIHDKGGTIRPRQSRFLTVPIGPHRQFRVPVPERTDLDLIPRRSGNHLLAFVSRGRFDPEFVLKKTVKIRATNYVSRIADGILGHVTGQTVKDVRKACDQAGDI